MIYLHNNLDHTYTDSHTKTFDSLLPKDLCIELDSEVCTCHTTPNCESTQSQKQ